MISIPRDDQGSLNTTGAVWSLKFYTAGGGQRQESALALIRSACKGSILGKYAIEVVDLVQEPGRATADAVMAIPMLVRESPGPIRKIIGNFSTEQRVLVSLNCAVAG